MGRQYFIPVFAFAFLLTQEAHAASLMADTFGLRGLILSMLSAAGTLTAGALVISRWVGKRRSLKMIAAYEAELDEFRRKLRRDLR